MKKNRFIITTIFLWFIIHQIIIITDGLISKPNKSEYAVILGNKINNDGTLSKRLKARVLKGLELYNDSLVKKIVVSGGLGKEGFYEAQKMAEFLVENGVKKQNIIIDDYGNNSWLTAMNFKKLKPNSKSVIIVTQFYHITRCKLAFRKLGIKNISAVSPNYFEIRDFYSLFREFFGYYKYLIL
ncbi:YdcF family protein [Cellulophaga sp. 20_2_10]|uniref:YdcF family protein n=1 Tax=Cellulophaga sp. 20_2_10 TaxID=2942476 RepID=UPI00201B148F|nr:YdcF family protein [Cellulophaga sp. 20_2_10]MCL5247653.1 YdcF family protein [Cellulophaga sp. 20_2_10]